MKNQKGITLVALVITIIILIILAGITISLVLGEDGLIAKSKRGAEAYQTAATNEQQLLDNINAFIDGKIDTISSGNGGTSGAGGGSQTPQQVIKSVGDVAISDYGQYVNIGTNILDRTIELEDGTTPSSDWRIFKKESNGVWLILADYMPNSSFDVSRVGLVACTDDSAIYGVKINTDRNDFLNALISSNWSGLISGSSLTGISGVQAKGAFGLEEWISSWEDKGYVNINTGIKQGLNNWNPKWGYYVYKDGEDSTNVHTYVNEDTDGYGNTLYFPHKSQISNCYGYKLASPSGQGHADIVTIWLDAHIEQSSYQTTITGVRPAVFIPSSVNFDATNSVWTIAQ